MPDIIKISELNEALALADAAEFPYYQDNGGQNTTYKAPMTQIGAKIVEGLTYQGINLPAGAGNKTVENSLNYLLNAIGGDTNGNISDYYDPTAAYVKGNLCIYDNVLYICTAPTTGTFDPSKWTATTIDNVIGSLTTLTTTDKSSLVGAVNEVNNALDMTDTASGAIATFDTSLALPLQGCTIAINAVQEGSGTPSPDNVRPISGFTGANIHVADDENPHVIDNVTAITWQSEAGTVYGGSLDVTTGRLTVTHGYITLDGSFNYTPNGITTETSTFIVNISGKAYGRNNFISDKFKASDMLAVGNADGRASSSNIAFCLPATVAQTVVAGKQWFSDNPTRLVYELATPVTYQLTPTQISAIVGTNNIFTDTNGDTTLEYYTKRVEQTVRIAEGVAVDVINNKNIDNLTTTNKTLVGAVNEVVTGLNTDITFTLKSDAKFTVASFVGKKAGIVNILNLKLTPTEATTIGTEIEVGNFANIYTYGSGTYYTGVVVDDQTKLVGSYLMTLGNQKLYLKFTDSTTRVIALTLVVFSA